MTHSETEVHKALKALHKDRTRTCTRIKLFQNPPLPAHYPFPYPAAPPVTFPADFDESDEDDLKGKCCGNNSFGPQKAARTASSCTRCIVVLVLKYKEF